MDDVELKPLTKVTDSTMHSLGLSLDSCETIELSCCIESVNGDTSRRRVPVNDNDQDLKVSIPSETLFSDIVEVVLQRLGYTGVETLGAKGVIQIQNWKPISLDAVTENQWASVGDVLGGLSKLITLKIYLFNSSKYLVVEDIKEKLLRFLLKHSRDLLQATGCPIKETVLEEVFSDKSNFPDHLKHEFNEWYWNQVKGEETAIRSGKEFETNDATNSYSSSDDDIFLGRNKDSEETGVLCKSKTLPDGAKTIVKNRMLGQLWMDRRSDFSKTRRARDKHAGKILSYGHRIHKTKEDAKPGNTFGDVISTAKSLPTALYNDDKLFSTEMMKFFSAKTDSMKETAREIKLNADFEENKHFPELPNKNAVYVVQPLPPARPGAENLEVILSENGSEYNDDSLSSEPQDLSMGVRNSRTKRDCDNLCVNSPGKHKEEKFDHKLVNQLITEQASTVANIKPNLPQFDGVDRTLAEQPRAIPLMVSDDAGSRNIVEVPDDDDDSFGSDQKWTDKSNLCKNNILPPSNLMPSFDFLSQFQGLLHKPNQHPASQLLSMSSTMNFMSRLHSSTIPICLPFQDYIQSGAENAGSDSEHRKRSRVFIDPISETPKLEQWFTADSHPSTMSIEEYTNELNRSVYRQRFPKLEPKNVQLWFKNHRAKIKRLKTECSISSA